MQPQQSRTRSRAASVLDTLAAGPCTLYEIAATLTMLQSRVRYTVDQLRESKLVFIGGWAASDTPGRVIPVYHLGAGPEVPPPPGARMQYLTNGHDYEAGSYLTAISLLWLKKTDA